MAHFSFSSDTIHHDRLTFPFRLHHNLVPSIRNTHNIFPSADPTNILAIGTSWMQDPYGQDQQYYYSPRRLHTATHRTFTHIPADHAFRYRTFTQIPTPQHYTTGTIETADDYIAPAIHSGSITIKDLRENTDIEICQMADICPICLDNINVGTPIRKIKHCSHLFHSHCIEQWLETNKKTCPVCRADIILNQ